MALQEAGNFADGLKAIRAAQGLGANLPAAERAKLDAARIEAEHMVATEGRLRAFLEGTFRPSDAAEACRIARISQAKKLYATFALASVRAFELDPSLASDVTSANRFTAACAAARAGAGQGDDATKTDEAARARWRKQAVEWLSADVYEWKATSGSLDDAQRKRAILQLEGWTKNPDLAGIRDDAEVGKRPRDEQDACRELWRGVAALLERLRGSR